MTTLDPVVFVIEAMSPNAADAASPVSLAGVSTPAENFPWWEFVDGGTRYMDFKCYLTKRYSGLGINLILPWRANTVTSGAVRWEAAIRRIGDDIENLGAAHTYSFQPVTDTTASVAGEVSYAVIPFTAGAQMDDLVGGEFFIARVRRVPGDAGDTLGESAFLFDVQGEEA